MDQRDKMSALLARAKTDSEFRAELEADPKAVVMREAGISAHHVEELGEADLAAVAGGVVPEEPGQWRCTECGWEWGDGFIVAMHMLFEHGIVGDPKKVG